MDDLKLSDEDKLNIIQDLIDQIHIKSGIIPVRSDELLQGKSFTSTIHTYQIAGSQINRKTQTSNLIQKVIQAQQISFHQKNEEVKNQMEIEGNQPQIYRYFKANVRCFRCKKVGHHNYACLDQQCCQYCLSIDHMTQKCPQKTVCYQCYQSGHVISQCKSSSNINFCQDCKRKHARRCCFLTKGIEPIKQMFNTDWLYNNDNIRCMSCLEYGHLICATNFAQRELEQQQQN